MFGANSAIPGVVTGGTSFARPATPTLATGGTANTGPPILIPRAPEQQDVAVDRPHGAHRGAGNAPAPQRL